MNKQNNSPFQSKPKKKAGRPPQNFVEALKSIGGSTVNSVKKDLISGTGQGMVDSITGQYPQSRGEDRPEQPDFAQEWLQQKEEEAQNQAEKRQRHREVINQPVYDRRQQEIEAKIKEIQLELKRLVKELANMDQGIQKAVEEEVAEPGTYHLNFFEKLRQYLVMLRKKVSESKNWMALSQQRKQAQRYYQSQVKKSGTKFMLSSERQIATQTG